MAAKNKPNEIHLTRIYDAPVKAVWDAWTDPKQVAKWWGPRGFTITTHKKDLRPGGRWDYTMHGPDAVDYPNITTYHEVEPYAKLVYDHGASADRPPLFRVTVFFSEAGGKTKMEMTTSVASPEALEEIKKIIKAASGESTWDRLAEFLEKEQNGEEKFVINRSFAAPLETMYEVWANPEHLAKWMAPKGFEMHYVRADVRAGGSSFYYMTGAGAGKMYGRCEYLELTPPQRLVYLQQFCDENEKLARHPFDANWPETMKTTIQLFAEGPEQTRVSITWQPHGAVRPAEMESFIKARAGMTQGWTGSFDKLEDYLRSR